MILSEKFNVILCSNNFNINFKYLICFTLAVRESPKPTPYFEGSQTNFFSQSAHFSNFPVTKDNTFRKRGLSCYTHRNMEIPSMYSFPDFQKLVFSNACKISRKSLSKKEVLSWLFRLLITSSVFGQSKIINFHMASWPLSNKDICKAS